MEVFQCTECNAQTRFVRFNNPATLIETRRGRCGEWANCFTLFCRAVGLQARFVLCTEDHVWTEVFDSASRNWVHCDPCENVIDRPLLYDKASGRVLGSVLGLQYSGSFFLYLGRLFGEKVSFGMHYESPKMIITQRNCPQ